MLKLIINPTDPEPELIARAAAAIRSGAVAVFPTDTVYGLGAALDDEGAVARIFGLKGRQSGKGLIAMIADIDNLDGLGVALPATAKRLMTKFWPGPLTMVLPAADSVPRRVTIGGTLGVRLPDNALVRALVRAVGSPLATTSANLAGAPSPTGPAAALAAVDGLVDLFIDGGECSLGIESTVVDTQTWPPTVFREGAVSTQSLWEALGIA